jgi:hypothetical protein
MARGKFEAGRYRRLLREPRVSLHPHRVAQEPARVRRHSPGVENFVRFTQASSDWYAFKATNQRFVQIS